MEIFLLTYACILMTIIFLIMFVPLINPNYKKQYQDSAVESDYNPTDRHAQFKDRINSLKTSLPIQSQPLSFESAPINNQEKASQDLPEEKLKKSGRKTPTKAAKVTKPLVDEDGLYSIPEGTEFPNIYDNSDVEIITAEYEKYMDDIINKKHGK